MKKLLILSLIIILASCKKEDVQPNSAKCWNLYQNYKDVERSMNTAQHEYNVAEAKSFILLSELQKNSLTDLPSVEGITDTLLLKQIEEYYKNSNGILSGFETNSPAYISLKEEEAKKQLELNTFNYRYKSLKNEFEKCGCKE